MNVLVRNFKWMMVLLSLMLAQGMLAQSREHIRKSIEEWGECRNVAITKTNGDLALYQENGIASDNCPESLNKALEELNEKEEYIDDVQLTENGNWVILYGDNGLLWSGIPKSLEKKLTEYNEKAEVITSVTFNDAGDWIIISTNFFSTSDPDVDEWLKGGLEKYGQLWAACVTDDAVVAVYEKGFQYTGEIPETLEKALDETELDIFRLKISGDAWFFADKDGKFDFNM